MNDSPNIGSVFYIKVHRVSFTHAEHLNKEENSKFYSMNLVLRERDRSLLKTIWQNAIATMQLSTVQCRQYVLSSTEAADCEGSGQCCCSYIELAEEKSCWSASSNNWTSTCRCGRQLYLSRIVICCGAEMRWYADHIMLPYSEAAWRGRHNYRLEDALKTSGVQAWTAYRPILGLRNVYLMCTVTDDSSDVVRGSEANRLYV